MKPTDPRPSSQSFDPDTCDATRLGAIAANDPNQLPAILAALLSAPEEGPGRALEVADYALRLSPENAALRAAAAQAAHRLGLPILAKAWAAQPAPDILKQPPAGKGQGS